MSGGFHDVSFPLALAIGARGGLQRKVDVVSLASGGEVRNALWASARRRWSVGVALSKVEALQQITAFFEARGGRLFSFRFRDFLDHSSALAGADLTPYDQQIGIGDGIETSFALLKQYGETARRITRPVQGSVRAAVDGSDVDVTPDYTSGVITFAEPPPIGAAITAGYTFDCEARFDTDQLEVSMDAVGAGQILSLPIIEVIGGAL